MEMEKGYALVTGASKGIGKEIARQLAEAGWPLILVARSADLLASLKADWEAAYGVPVRTFAVDLSAPEAPTAIAKACTDEGLRVQILVNNAGFGVWEQFEKADMAEMEAMNALNVTALLRMCHAFIPLLRRCSRSHILNVSSLGAFQPIPFMALYGAGKAYVRSFSYALRNELRGSPVRVTCLSPGGVESEFADRAGSHVVVERNKRFVMPTATCARKALRAMFRGRAEVIPGWYNVLSVRLARMLPTTWVTQMARKIMEKPA